MTTLTIYQDAAPYPVRETLSDFTAIAAAMAPSGVQLERWEADVALGAELDDADILSAYATDIDRLKAAGGYQSCDVARLTPDHPARGEMRAKFLAEHVHDDDEVRFFVEGSGLFYIRDGGSILALECTRGDLIVLPAGTRHWFDTGSRPSFTAIRLFTTPDGWVARFTGDTIAEAIPLYENAGVTPHAILTDIEGTTSSIAFVHDVLFPYARERLAAFVATHPAETDPILDQVRAETGQPDLDRQACVDQLLAWLDADAKIGPLKTLQGLIWAEGYTSGELTGHVYTDAAAGLRRWHDAGIPLYIYSSGSVAAQKLLFGRTDHGDLTPLFTGHFDTAIGGKKEKASYAAIARAIGIEPAAILFLSDIAEELEAAEAAGLSVILLARDGLPESSSFPVATDFDGIVPA